MDTGTNRGADKGTDTGTNKGADKVADTGTNKGRIKGRIQGRITELLERMEALLVGSGL